MANYFFILRVMYLQLFPKLAAVICWRLVALLSLLGLVSNLLVFCMWFCFRRRIFIKIFILRNIHYSLFSRGEHSMIFKIPKVGEPWNCSCNSSFFQYSVVLVLRAISLTVTFQNTPLKMFRLNYSVRV